MIVPLLILVCLFGGLIGSAYGAVKRNPCVVSIGAAVCIAGVILAVLR